MKCLMLKRWRGFNFSEMLLARKWSKWTIKKWVTAEESSLVRYSQYFFWKIKQNHFILWSFPPRYPIVQAFFLQKVCVFSFQHVPSSCFDFFFFSPSQSRRFEFLLLPSYLDICVFHTFYSWALLFSSSWKTLVRSHSSPLSQPPRSITSQLVWGSD